MSAGVFITWTMEAAASHERSVLSCDAMILFDFFFQVKGSSINCNDLDAGVRMKHAFLNKEVEITHLYFFPLNEQKC